jgi:hypothetical protein
MNAYGQVVLQCHAFLISALAGECGQLHTPAAEPVAKEALSPIVNYASLDALENAFLPCQESSHNS